MAISMYNTGSTSRGFRNGYVAKVVGNAGVTDGMAVDYPEAPQSSTNAADVQSMAASENTAPLERNSSRQGPPPAWNLFESAAYERNTLIKSASEEGTMLWSN